MARGVLCSTGCIVGRVNGRDHRLIMKYRPALNCDGMEFMMYESWYPRWEEISSDLKSSGILFPTMHAEKTVGDRISRDAGTDTRDAVRDFEINCRVAERIGAKTMVLHLWGGPPSDRHIDHNIAMYATLSAIAENSGLTLAVENVVCNRQDPLTHMKRLCEVYPECAFTIDTKMAAFHDQLETLEGEECAYLWRGGHVKHLHVNDYAGGYMDWDHLRTMFIGRGHIDFDAFFRTVKKYNYDGWLTCECTAMQPDGSVDIPSLNDSLAKVRAYDKTYLCPEGS